MLCGRMRVEGPTARAAEDVAQASSPASEALRLLACALLPLGGGVQHGGNEVQGFGLGQQPLLRQAGPGFELLRIPVVVGGEGFGCAPYAPADKYAPPVKFPSGSPLDLSLLARAPPMVAHQPANVLVNTHVEVQVKVQVAAPPPPPPPPPPPRLHVLPIYTVQPISYSNYIAPAPIWTPSPVYTPAVMQVPLTTLAHSYRPYAHVSAAAAAAAAASASS